MAGRAVNRFHPDSRHHDAHAAGDEEDPGPAEFVRDPAGERREEERREVLTGVEDGGGSAAFGSGKPCGDDAAVSGEGWCLGESEK